MKKPLKLYGLTCEILNNPTFAAVLGDINGCANGEARNRLIDDMKARYPNVTQAVKLAVQELIALHAPTEAIVVNGGTLYAYAPEVYNGIRSAGYKLS